MSFNTFKYAGKTLKDLENTLSQGEKNYLLNIIILKETYFFFHLAFASGIHIKETELGKDNH